MDYDAAVRSSWIATELKLVQNAEPAVAKYGEDFGTILAGIDMWMRTLRIGLPISMKHHRDYEELQRADLYKPIDYPKPDGVLSFDRLTNVAFSFTNHAEDQPNHLKLKGPRAAIRERVPRLRRPLGALLSRGGVRMAGRRGGPRRSSRSTARTASTARLATSRTPTRISNGPRPRAAGGRIIRICEPWS